MNDIPVENLFLIDIETVSETRNYDSLNEEWKGLWSEKIHKALPEKFLLKNFTR